MDARYDHQLFEATIYKKWLEAGAFNPDTVKISLEPAVDSKPTKADRKKQPFCIIMPPPNANDPLHIGHAMFVSIEDILIRYHRMLGDDSLWLPGTDHAGIETQFVFEKKLKKQGKSRFDFDRETLYSMIWDYVQENSDVATNQIQRLGASADWSRFTFTLDKGVVNSVLETFLKLNEEGLIYRANKLVNYCTFCGTAFSNLEILYADQTSPLYYVKYFFVDEPEEFITVATVRPEPIFADTHLAVNPGDKKHSKLIGRQVLNPLTGEKMSIIGDEFVDPAFGTGIVKLTPAHDHNDFAVAQKHNLPMQQALDTTGRMTKIAGEFAGLKVKAAREAIVAKLTQSNHIDHVDTKYQNRVATCYRCKRAIEPLLLPQFYVSVRPLTTAVLAEIDKGNVRIHGAGHDKILRHWLEILEDWNISRQIVWGIRMPVWYSTTKYPEIRANVLLDGAIKKASVAELLAEGLTLEQIALGLQELTAPIDAEYVISTSKPGEEYLQETDTFDTWFSSSQWPFVTLQNKQPNDLARFYPTSVMETAYDILMFWVMRMLLMGVYTQKQVPFRDVYLHGLVRDEKGQKMSKSKGNVINPLEITEKYGADALRMALVIRSSAGLDKSVGEPDLRAARNFTNKLWNAARFVITTLDEAGVDAKTIDFGSVSEEFSQHLSDISSEVTKSLDNFQIGLAADRLYNEFWHWFCDECIEKSKAGEVSKKELLVGLSTFLVLLHPFVPFVSEAVWQELLDKKLVSSPLLATTAWPTVQ